MRRLFAIRGHDRSDPALGSRRADLVIGYRPSRWLGAGPMREESLVLLHDFHQVFARPYKGMWLTLRIQR